MSHQQARAQNQDIMAYCLWIDPLPPSPSSIFSSIEEQKYEDVTGRDLTGAWREKSSLVDFVSSDIGSFREMKQHGTANERAGTRLDFFPLSVTSSEDKVFGAQNEMSTVLNDSDHLEVEHEPAADQVSDRGACNLHLGLQKVRQVNTSICARPPNRVDVPGAEVSRFTACMLHAGRAAGLATLCKAEHWMFGGCEVDVVWRCQWYMIGIARPSSSCSDSKSSSAPETSGNVISDRDSSSHAVRSVVARQTRDLTASYKRNVLPILQAVLPQSCIQHSVTDSEQLTKTHLQLMLYGITNNLAGLDSNIPLTMIFDYLNEPLTGLLESNAVVSYRLGITLNTPAIQSMLEVFFRCAVEKGDARVVKELLTNPDVKIEANQQTLTVEGTKYTVIERSARLQHLEITRLLLEAGADPNKSFQDRTSYDQRVLIHYRDEFIDIPHDSVGAMDHAMSNHVVGSLTGYMLAEILLKKGALTSNTTLRVLVHKEDIPMIDILLEYGLERHLSRWAENRFLHSAVRILDVEKLSKLFARLHAHNFDFSELECSSTAKQRGSWWGCRQSPPSLMDCTALRGELPLLAQLRSYGAPISHHTTVAAVQSSNPTLVRYLLENGAHAHGFSSCFATTAFAQAVRMRSPDLIELMYSLTPSTRTPDHFAGWAALAAVAETGNIEMVEEMINCPRSCNAFVLDHALMRAVAGDQTAVAVLLLEAGANVNVFENSCEICLLQRQENTALSHSTEHALLRTAICNKNAVLAKKLLEHNANLNDTLVAAVQFNNVPLLEDLIFAGAADVSGSALAMAVANCSMISLLRLCQAGPISTELAIHTAIDMNANSALEILLQYSRGSLDEGILVSAMAKGSSLFQRVLQYFQHRELCGSGWLALNRAIESGREDLVQSLIDAGAALPRSLRNDNRFGRRLSHPLATAIRHNSHTDTSIVKMILDNGLPVDSAVEVSESGPWAKPSRRTALMVAVSAKSEKAVRLLLRYGADVNMTASRGVTRTTLQIAAEDGSFRIAQLLLTAGANANAVPAQRSGLTAVQAAARGGFIGIVEMLCKDGADLMASGCPVDGRCAIEAAAERGRTGMVSYLLHLGAWPTTKLESAITFAKKGGYSATARFLQRAVEDKDTEHNDGLDIWTTRRPHDPKSTVQRVARSQVQELPGMIEGDCLNLSAPSNHLDFMADDSFSLVTQRELAEMDVDLDLESSIPDELDRHVCQTCIPPLSLSNASALRRHQHSKHHDMFPAQRFKCGVCLKTFDRRDTYKRHKGTHDKQDLEACPSCNKRYRKDYLRVHARTCKARA
nr:isoform 5 of ankyrin-2 [Quercus suber]